MYKKLLFLAALITASNSNAALTVIAPDKACGLLADIGLVTRSWKNHLDEEFSCSTPYKDIGTAFPLPNNLAYYVEGGKNSVKLVELVLNINNPSNSSSANSELQKAAASLFFQVTGEKIPESVTNAIKHGKNFSLKAGQSNAQVIRVDWPTGKGYEIRLVIE
jgi:hypothetical protein